MKGISSSADIWVQCGTCGEWFVPAGNEKECLACRHGDPPIGAIDDMLDEPDMEVHSDWAAGGWAF